MQPSRLFLNSSSLISLVLRPLLTLADQSRLASRISQFSISTSLNWRRNIALADLFDLLNNWDDWKSLADTGDNFLGGNFLLGSIILLVLTDLAGEEDESGTV